MVDYRVRAESLLNLVNDIKKGLLIPDAYFQRNLVWLEVHKKEFIKTILLGFPFPEIFISKGKIDLEEMKTVSCIVDGQQRSNAICCFLENEFEVEGRYYNDLDDNEKSRFLKYEIAVIELDLENDDIRVKEIFQRINRTSNSLTTIEKLASEFSTSEYMLVAKLITDQIEIVKRNMTPFQEDPNIPTEFYQWASKIKSTKSSKLFTSKSIFSTREIAKQNNLMYTLNIMSTLLGGIYNRNDKVVEFLNNYSRLFNGKDDLMKIVERISEIILQLKFKQKSYWNNKANFFTLFIAVSEKIQDGVVINIDDFKQALEEFENNLPEAYKLAANEGVNNKNERVVRHNFIIDLIDSLS